jgi:hypothetical protein
MTLFAILVSKMLFAYRIEPGSAHGREFFKVFGEGVAQEVMRAPQRPLH